MYLYSGTNPEIRQNLKKEFEGELEAKEFANDHSVKFPKFTVTDLEENEIIYSNKMADDELDATNSMMFPNKD